MHMKSMLLPLPLKSGFQNQLRIIWEVKSTSLNLVCLKKHTSVIYVGRVLEESAILSGTWLIICTNNHMFVMYVVWHSQELIPWGGTGLYMLQEVHTDPIYVMCVVRDFQTDIISKGTMLCMEIERHMFVTGVEKHLLSWVTWRNMQQCILVENCKSVTHVGGLSRSAQALWDIR